MGEKGAVCTGGAIGFGEGAGVTRSKALDALSRVSIGDQRRRATAQASIAANVVRMGQTTSNTIGGTSNAAITADITRLAQHGGSIGNGEIDWA